MRTTTSPIDLPFVGRKAGNDLLSYWDVPSEGDFVDGVNVGVEMALAYLEYLGKSSESPPTLPQIVIDMVAAGPLPDSLHGQLVGFFSELERAIKSTRAVRLDGQI